MFPFNMGGAGTGAAGTGGMGAAGMGQGMGNMMGGAANPMGVQGGTGMGGAAGANPMMASMATMLNPAMQALYQQYAMRWAAMQKFAAQAAQAAGMPGMGAGAAVPMMAGPMAGPMQGQGQMGGPGPRGGQMQGGRGASGGQGGGQGEDPAIFYKTRICNRWKEGTCPYGDTCKYAHGDHELRTMNDNAAEGRGMVPPQAGRQPMGGRGAGAAGPAQSMRKTRLCEEFMQTGRCKYGDRCTYAHGQHELRPPPTAGMQGERRENEGRRTDMHKTRLCERFMQTGQCGYGDKCTFAHGMHELRSKPPGGMGMGGAPAPRPPQGPRPAYQQQGGPGAAGGMGGAGSEHMAGQNQGAGLSSGGAVGGVGSGGGTPINQNVSGQGYVTEDGGGEEVDGGAGGGGGAGKREREEEHGEEGADGVGAGAGAKRLHVEEEHIPEPDCPHCAALVRSGRQKVLSAISQLENSKAQQLAAMILATSQRLDQLWSKCTPTMVLGWLAKAQGLSIMDKIELLKTVGFHVHATDGASRAAGGGLGLDSEKYVEMGLPPDCADFVYVCMEGKEGTASMSEYFHMLEVCKQMFGIDDNNYYAVSTAVAGIMMGM